MTTKDKTVNAGNVMEMAKLTFFYLQNQSP